ncbi:hypothetical protein CFP56_017916 [Quercus suber]|uniref:Uncharacterized protein n=1 Tax=Quercus suber TaxID=58331 RepID=A0AAW0KJ71_QUESU
MDGLENTMLVSSFDHLNVDEKQSRSFMLKMTCKFRIDNGCRTSLITPLANLDYNLDAPLDDSQNQLMLTLIPCMWPQIKQVLTRNEVMLMWLKMMFTKICLHN